MGSVYIRSTLVAEIHDIIDTVPANRAWLEYYSFISDLSEWQISIGVPEYPKEYGARMELLLEKAREAGCSVSLMNILVLAQEKQVHTVRFINI